MFREFTHPVDVLDWPNPLGAAKEKEDTQQESGLFRIKPAADWLAEAKRQPLPKMLFGEFWLEGELAILFADTSAGKSILAVQIAESLARGRAIAPMPCTSQPRKVLYFDFELTGKQFEMRYSREPREGDTHLKRHYAFSRNFLRAEVDANVSLPEGAGNFEDLLTAEIEAQVRRNRRPCSDRRQYHLSPQRRRAYGRGDTAHAQVTAA